jgi:glycolate oxidase FAD binding subunit
MTPETEADLAGIIKQAEGPLRVEGGGTRPIGGASNGARLSTAAMTGIETYEPGALTLVVRAGTPVAEVEAALQAEGQRLAFEPMDHRGLLGCDGTPTIGGVVAGNVSGPRRISLGACRDFMLGVRFVDGRGAVVKNGGRVMKNVTGYDLVKLLTGSRGTLGVLSEVSLKVLPVPETAGMLVLEGLDIARAVAAMARALGSPFEVTGAAHDPGAGRTLIRVEGFETQVSYRLARLAELLAEFGEAAQERDPATVAVAWAAIRDVAPFHAVPGDVWRISCKPSDAPELAARLEAEGLLFDWGGGLIWACLPEGTDARARLGAFDGHATLVRASEATRAALPVFPPEPAPLAALGRGLRARFDPRGILNPGLMG